MLTRSPSNQRAYDDFWSGDQAFLAAPAAPAKDAPPEAVADYEKAVAERAHKFATARETGRWDELLVEGRQPTKFVMRPIGPILRRIMDRFEARQIGHAESVAIAFRAAIESVENFGDFRVKRVDHDIFGQLAAEDLVAELDRITPAIVTELGLEVLRRARGPSPK